MRALLLALLGLLVTVVLGIRGARVAFARTLDEALADVRAAATERLHARGIDLAAFDRDAEELILVGVKDARRLEVWARGRDETAARHVTDYPVLAASGLAGPKLREGDRQVPEGVYRLEGLNPNSRFHLSMKVSYPSAFDLGHARTEGRTSPGSDIFIHGGARSVGCLALGDPAIEELFLLVSELGLGRVRVLLCPSDPRAPFVRTGAESLPAWLPELDAQLDAELTRFGIRS